MIIESINYSLNASIHSRMVLSVHDELVFEIHYDETDKAIGFIKEIMEQKVSLTVHLQVHNPVGNYWDKFKKK